MVLPNSSATLSTGDQIATDNVGLGTTEAQAQKLLGPNGHILGSQEGWALDIPAQVHVAVANTIHWDLFNTSATLLYIESIRQLPDIVTAVTGVATSWTLRRTTAVGTGGAAITPWPADTNYAALPSAVTARSKPTGGATAGTLLASYQTHSEETNTGTLAIAAAGGLELVPRVLLPENGGSGIVLRPNQGVSVTQVTSSAAGSTGWQVVFTLFR